MNEYLTFTLIDNGTAYEVKKSASFPTSGSVEIVIPSTYNGLPVTTIDSYAFSYCYALTSVTIPDSVTEIGYYAFSDCTALTSVTIHNSVTTIGGYAFSGCTALTSIEVDENNTNYTSENGVLYNKVKTTLIQYPAGNTRTSFEIPDSVTTIGNSAFYGCYSLTSMIIPDSVTTIGNSAFYGCRSITSVTIPDSVTEIGNSAFYGCRSITSVTIPDSVTTISDSAFGDCTALTSVTIPDSVTTIGDSAFRGCYSLTSVNIPNGVTTISEHAFGGCRSLTSVNIPNGVTTIGDYAFNGCESLTSVNIPNGVTTIGNSAFRGCYSLTSMIIPDSVTEIGNSAFSYCESLTSVTIPDSVTTIGNSAFSHCKALKKMRVTPTAPPALASTNAIPNTIETIEVKQGSVEAYKTATNWAYFADKIVGYIDTRTYYKTIFYSQGTYTRDQFLSKEEYDELVADNLRVEGTKYHFSGPDIYEEIDSLRSELEEDIAELNEDLEAVSNEQAEHDAEITAIQSKIPTEATSTNQLADKAYVDASFANGLTDTGYNALLAEGLTTLNLTEYDDSPQKLEMKFMTSNVVIISDEVSHILSSNMDTIDVVFSTGFDDTNYKVLLTPFVENDSFNIHCNLKSKTANGFSIKVWTDNADNTSFIQLKIEYLVLGKSE